MCAIDELAPGLWSYSEPRQGIPTTATSYVLRDGEDTILIDPLPHAGREGRWEAELAALDELTRGRVRILVTIPFHVRGSEVLWRRWQGQHEVTIYGHEHCATRLDDRSAFRPLKGGETLAGGVRAHAIGKPTRAEFPYELPSHNAVAFGDTVLEIDGELRVWAELDNERREAWYRERFLPTLAPLVDFAPEHVLVTHGRPVVHDGARELRAALERPPWRRTKRRD